MCSTAFQISVALYPDQLQHYAFLVKWVWIACGLCWMIWLLSHPWMQQHLWHCHASPPPVRQPNQAHAVVPKAPSHNVRFVGFRRIQIDPDFPDLTLATLCFENALIPGKPVVDFHFARLQVNYSDFSTEEMIAEAFLARWHDSPHAPIDISAGRKQCAIIASCISSKWATDSLIDTPINPALEYDFGGSEYKHESVPLPLGRIKIKATLIGTHNLSIPPVEGILTLGADGSASFLNTSV